LPKRAVTGGGLDAAVAEKHLDDTCIGALFQQVRREAVPQNVRGHTLGEAALLGRVAAGLRDRFAAEVVFRAPGGKQPTLRIRPQRAIVAAQDRQQARRQHRIPVFLAFALFDAQPSMRWESMSLTFSDTASVIRSPAP
jgi:hypothetical protein